MTAIATPAGPTARSAAGPLEVLVEAVPATTSDVRGLGMPTDLEARYGGQLLVPLRPDRPALVANFVSTIDGVVALGAGELSGGGLISGFHEPDRFVMALLRSLADAVVIGAGTLRGSSSHRWVPGHLEPELAPLFAEWRASMGLAPAPTTVVVSGSGVVPVGHPGLNAPGVPVVIATSSRGAARLHETRLAAHVTVAAIGDEDRLAGPDVLGLVAGLGARVVLSEGGPHLLGELIAQDLLDELFLTIAPQLVGRGAERSTLVEGISLPPDEGRWQELVSVRRSGQHLFLRYRRGRPSTRTQWGARA